MHTSALPQSINRAPTGPTHTQVLELFTAPTNGVTTGVPSVTRVYRISQAASSAVLSFLPFQAPAGPGVWAPHPSRGGLPPLDHAHAEELQHEYGRSSPEWQAGATKLVPWQPPSHTSSWRGLIPLSKNAAPLFEKLGRNLTLL